MVHGVVFKRSPSSESKRERKSVPCRRLSNCERALETVYPGVRPVLVASLFDCPSVMYASGSRIPSDSDSSTGTLKQIVDACRLNERYDEYKGVVDQT